MEAGGGVEEGETGERVTDVDLHKLNRAVRDALYELQIADTQLAGIFGFREDDPLRAHRITIARKRAHRAAELLGETDGSVPPP